MEGGGIWWTEKREKEMRCEREWMEKGYNKCTIIYVNKLMYYEHPKLYYDNPIFVMFAGR